MAHAEVSIDASKGALTVRGDQAFVVETLEKYKFVFENVPKSQPLQAKSAPHEETSDTSGNAAKSSSALEAFPNVYDIDGDNISILISPPGNNLTAQARALILLYLYARYRTGTEPVPGDALKEQCKVHACLDPKNFSGHLKSQKSLVTVTGSNSSLTARLTVPGRKAAEELAQNLQNAA